MNKPENQQSKELLREMSIAEKEEFRSFWKRYKGARVDFSADSPMHEKDRTLFNLLEKQQKQEIMGKMLFFEKRKFMTFWERYKDGAFNSPGILSSEYKPIKDRILFRIIDSILFIPFIFILVPLWPLTLVSKTVKKWYEK